jgi:hypothetical protein
VALSRPAVSQHRHGEGWEGLRAGVESPDGWPLYLGRYAGVFTGSASAG